MTKDARPKVWTPIIWSDGSQRSYVEPPAPSNTFSWNPGYGVRTNKQPYAELLSTQLAEYDEIASDVGSNIGFIATQFAWGDLEPSKGSYGAGLDLIHQHLDRCKTNGHRLGIQLKTRKFGGSSVPSTPQANMRATPDWLINEGRVKVCTDGGGEGATLHDAQTMDYLLALIAAIAGEFDADPMVEFFEFGELSYSQWGDPAFTQENYIAQVNRLCDALPGLWTKKIAGPGINYVWGHNQTVTYALRSHALGNAISAPDAIVYDANPAGSGWTYGASWGMLGIAGYTWNGAEWVKTNPDRRLEAARKYEMQVVPNTSLTAAIYADHAADVLKCTHFIYTKMNSTAEAYGAAGCAWNTPNGVKQYLNNLATRRALRTAFPSKLAERGVTPITGET